MKNDIVMGVRIPSALYKKSLKIANQQGLTLSAMIRLMLVRVTLDPPRAIWARAKARASRARGSS